MLPTRRLLLLIFITAVIGVAVSIWTSFSSWWSICLGILGGFALIDLLWAYRLNPVEAQREVPGNLPLGVTRDVTLTFTNTSTYNLSLSVYDHSPEQVEAQGMPVNLNIARGEEAHVTYLITPKERGVIIFPLIQIRFHSPLGLWERNSRLAVSSTTRVYPNFAAVAHLSLMATDNKLSQMGIIKKQRRGEGQDFHQLREYREGDGLRQIDWKATSRVEKLISREYQDERDQEIIFLLDCGQRMNSKDDELSHFDHTLNAILLLSYVALRQGDGVGLSTFAGEQRWSSPAKGKQALQKILNNVFDLQTSNESPDYVGAATQLMVRHKKRALVIILTNLRDEDNDDIIPALKLLRKRHLVMLTSLREDRLETALNKNIQTLDDAIHISALHSYLQHRQHTFDKIRSHKVISVDTVPKNLSVDLINSYLNIKRSGVL